MSEKFPVDPLAIALRLAEDDAFITRWQEIFATRDLHTELEALKFDGIKAIYLGRALFHAYHAEIDAYIQGRDEPPGGFDTSLGGVPVYHGGREMPEDGIRVE